MKRPAILCAAAAVVALFACSSGNGAANGSFPYSGPSCPPSVQQQLSACFGCYEQSCGASCITSACSDFFSCICACNQADTGCFQNCVPKAETAACTQCAQSVNNSSCQKACGSQCGSTSVGGVMGGGSGGGQVCDTSNGACPITFCATQQNGMCTSAYYEVGGQTFQCASCTDTTACQQAANDACLDAGPVADTGPGPDVGPPTDVGPVPDSPVFDASGATCHSMTCGTMGQSMEYCEFDNGEGGACTQAWYQVGSQIFNCTDCTQAGCQAAAQAASKACP